MAFRYFPLVIRSIALIHPSVKNFLPPLHYKLYPSSILFIHFKFPLSQTQLTLFLSSLILIFCPAGCLSSINHIIVLSNSTNSPLFPYPLFVPLTISQSIELSNLKRRSAPHYTRRCFSHHLQITNSINRNLFDKESTFPVRISVCKRVFLMSYQT